MEYKKNETAEQKNATEPKIEPDPPETGGQADGGERIYGEVCPACSSTQLYRNGTCKVCADCGTTTGCS